MKKKTTVILMVLLLALSLTLSGCSNKKDAGAENLNDDLYNGDSMYKDDTIGHDLDNMGNDLKEDADKLGEDIKNGTEDILDGNNPNT